jgi:hypothetical protein
MLITIRAKPVIAASAGREQTVSRRTPAAALFSHPSGMRRFLNVPGACSF